MAKRRTKRADARAKKKGDKEAGMNRPSGKSRYGKKNRPRELARGYSTRETSPFYLSPSQVKALRGASGVEAGPSDGVEQDEAA
jgi:hypothetical protein